MQDTSANPYTVRLNSARLVNAYMGDLRLAGSRRNTQEDRGEERTYKVTINTASDRLKFVRGVQSVGHQTAKNINNDIEKKIAETAYPIIKHVLVLSNLPKDAAIQKDKKAEELKARELQYGKLTSDMMNQPHEGAVVKGLHEGGVLQGYGTAVGKMAVDAFSKHIEDVRNAFGNWKGEKFWKDGSKK